MMQFAKEVIEAAAHSVNRFVNLEVTFNEKNIFVIAETSQALNEFEVQLAVASVEWDGDTCDGAVLVDTIINVQGVRTDFRKRYNDEWQARYDIVTR